MIVLANDNATDVTAMPNAGDKLWIRTDQLAQATGFNLKPEGACMGDLCVPIRDDEKDSFLASRSDELWFNVSQLASKLGQPFVHDADESVWSLGAIPELRRSTLESAIAPDFEISDRNGDLIRLSDFRGKKVLIVTWASW